MTTNELKLSVAKEAEDKVITIPLGKNEGYAFLWKGTLNHVTDQEWDWLVTYIWDKNWHLFDSHAIPLIQPWHGWERKAKIYFELKD